MKLNILTERYLINIKLYLFIYNQNNFLLMFTMYFYLEQLLEFNKYKIHQE